MSTAGQIGAAVQAAVRAIGLAMGTDPATTLKPENVVVRNRAELGPAPKEGPPKVLVVVADDGGELERLTATASLKTWLVAVVIVTANAAPLGDDERLRTWREQIDAAVYVAQRRTFAGLAGFNQCKASGKSPFDPAGLGQNVVWSTQNYAVEVIGGQL